MKDPFEFWERNGRLDFQREDVRIYWVDGEYYLFVGQIMYASTTERAWYVRNVMPHAKGSVLEIGLGLGCASKVILANPKVKHLLTVENNESVIAAYGRLLRRHHIILQDAEQWAREIPKVVPLFDLIFVDHYTFSEDTVDGLQELAHNLSPLLKEGGRMIFWIDENAADEEKAQIKSLWLEK